MSWYYTDWSWTRTLTMTAAELVVLAFVVSTIVEKLRHPKHRGT